MAYFGFRSGPVWSGLEMSRTEPKMIQNPYTCRRPNMQSAVALDMPLACQWRCQGAWAS